MYEEEDYVDKIIGIISLDGGKNSIGLDRLRYISAYLNLPYMDSRYDATIEKKALRSKLKSFVRKSMDNARLVEYAINHISEAQDHFEYKEMLRLKVLIPKGGVLRYNGIPIGSSFESVQDFLLKNMDLKTEIITALSKKQN